MFIRASTYEWTSQTWKLVVVHEFHGETIEKANHVLLAHIESDAFFRGCTEGPPYRGIQCYTTVEIVS